ncbi:hypothetical protein BKP37_13575 [Anaerobacillus alkalilacustris]|uniref:Uncharacterized protein n=1 Tax=Anaerobacillus alkalilacustris TaxID=393763 RepID=A0A1S2LK47_9BACI|nr:hypothetical protein [Anaerobacillus alkalilacustris]OIJ12463.1 hypothetical protein BKP37_13575 [Anaerobacillus alkalilacustris]
MIFSEELLDFIYIETTSILKGVKSNKGDLLEEVKMFELSMSQIKNHPWHNLTVKKAKHDTSSPLYHNIQSTYVGNDPEEDYKEVLIWKVADMLYVTAAVDHHPEYLLKWDVVVFNG